MRSLKGSVSQTSQDGTTTGDTTAAATTTTNTSTTAATANCKEAAGEDHDMRQTGDLEKQ